MCALFLVRAKNSAADFEKLSVLVLLSVTKLGTICVGLAFSGNCVGRGRAERASVVRL